MQRELEFGAVGGGVRVDRVVLHLDLDCFYCQVEQVRLGIPVTTPLAVQQWETVIAVNYAARAASVARHANYRECFARCPELKLVHVPTFSTADPARGARPYGATGKDDVACPSRDTHKASLQPYREASLCVFFALRRALASCYGSIPFVMEKASVDEVFLDISEIVNKLLADRYGLLIRRGRLIEGDGGERYRDLDWSDRGNPAVPATLLTESEGPRSKYDLDDLCIYLGCEIANTLRQKVFDELSYTVSAGVAHNKTLAKLASALHKPNQQTFVLNRHVGPWMRQVPFRKIRFLGGKLGGMLLGGLKGQGGTKAETETEAMEGGEYEGEGEGEDDNDDDDNDNDNDNDNDGEQEPPRSNHLRAQRITAEATAAELWPLTIDELQDRLKGDRSLAHWAYNIIRGKDPTPVAPRLQTKSFMSVKKMRVPLKDWQSLSDWLLLLVTELSGRLLEDFQLNHRWPHALTIHFKRPHQRPKSRSLDFPFAPDQIPAKNAALADICVNLLAQEHKEATPIWPCSQLAVAVTRFRPVVEGGEEARKRRSSTIDEFIVRSRPRTTAPPRQPSPPPRASRPAKRDITHYFSRSPPGQNVPAGSGDADGLRCSKCSKSLAGLDALALQEHADYHLALQLQGEIDRGVGS